MTDDSLLKQLGKLIDTKLKPIKKQLGVLTAKATSHDKKFDSISAKLSSHDAKFESLEKKLSSHDAKFESLEKKLSSHDAKFESLDDKIETLDMKIELVNKKIDQSQEETIETLSELIHAGYAMHEKRIKNIENHLHLPQPQG